MKTSEGTRTIVEERIVGLLTDLQGRLQHIDRHSWQDLDSLARELSSYCESCLTVCQEFLTHQEFAGF